MAQNTIPLHMCRDSGSMEFLKELNESSGWQYKKKVAYCHFEEMSTKRDKIIDLNNDLCKCKCNEQMSSTGNINANCDLIKMPIDFADRRSKALHIAPRYVNPHRSSYESIPVNFMSSTSLIYNDSLISERKKCTDAFLLSQYSSMEKPFNFVWKLIHPSKEMTDVQCKKNLKYDLSNCSSRLNPIFSAKQMCQVTNSSERVKERNRNLMLNIKHYSGGGPLNITKRTNRIDHEKQYKNVKSNYSDRVLGLLNGSNSLGSNSRIKNYLLPFSQELPSQDKMFHIKQNQSYKNGTRCNRKVQTVESAFKDSENNEDYDELIQKKRFCLIS